MLWYSRSQQVGGFRPHLSDKRRSPGWLTPPPTTPQRPATWPATPKETSGSFTPTLTAPNNCTGSPPATTPPRTDTPSAGCNACGVHSPWNTGPPETTTSDQTTKETRMGYTPEQITQIIAERDRYKTAWTNARARAAEFKRPGATPRPPLQPTAAQPRQPPTNRTA